MTLQAPGWLIRGCTCFQVAEAVRDDYWIPQELNSVKQFLNQAIQLRNTSQQVMAAEHGKGRHFLHFT